MTADATPLPLTTGDDATPLYQPGVVETEAYADPSARVGSVIAGRYKLIEALGVGGMGEVFLAQQTEPVKRAVAVKVVKAGMDSRAVLARFEAERQALALMDHPNIAKVLDAGITEGGRPFFVMELVKGVPITQYCDQQRLTPRQRLELFVPVCQAIQHAHQKGVIHRDIKPSNVLVALYDDRPVPKVIDFGVAKATGQALTDMTLMTGLGSVVGTPEYMSPEQASLNNLDIDTRSDVYSLGVLLYELLTGSTPVDRKSLGRAALLEILRIVREVEAPKPSAKLSSLDTLPSVAACRGTEPAKLSKLMKGELDWVLLKALEKDRSRRYETANGLARDIQRYLADELVEARPPSAGYWLRKLVRRHKGRVVAAGLVFVALVAGIIGTTLGLVEARRQTGIARATAERERLAKQEAETHLDFARKGNEILGSIFESLNPEANYATVGEFSQALRDGLDRAARQLEGSAIGDPLEVARMQIRLAASLNGLGDSARALRLFEKSLATHQVVLGPNHPATLGGINNVAMAHRFCGDLESALLWSEEALSVSKAVLGAEHPVTMGSKSNLVRAYMDAGKLDSALSLAEDAMRFAKTRLDPDHPHTLACISQLAACYYDAGMAESALPLYQEALRITRAKWGPDHTDTLLSMNGLALGYRAVGRLDLALPLLEEALRLKKARFGSEHPETLVSMNNLASGYQAADKLDLALPLWQEAMRLAKARFGPDHRDTLMCMGNLAACYGALGRLELARPLEEETIKLSKAKLGAEHPLTLTFMHNLATYHRNLRHFDRSDPLYLDVLRLREKTLGRNHPDTQRTLACLGASYDHAGRHKQSIPLLLEAYRAAKTDPELSWVRVTLLHACLRVGEVGLFRDLVREWVADDRKRLAPGSPQLSDLLVRAGDYLLEAGAFFDAEALLRECVTIREENMPEDWRTFNAHSLLGGAMLGQRKFAEAESLLLRGYEGMKAREHTIPPQTATKLGVAVDRLAGLYVATGKTEEAKRWQAERAKYPPEALTAPLQK